MEENLIIIDVEWDPNGSFESPSVLQLAAVKLNDCMQSIDSFFSFIKPNNEIPDMSKIINFMPITEENIITGKDPSTVLKEFSDWCGNNYLIVIWGSFNLQVFKAFVKGYIQVDQSNVLDLQQIFMIISGKSAMNLEKACIDFGSKITYPLHNSLNDAFTLAELYRKLQPEYDFNSLVLQYSMAKAEKKQLKSQSKRKRQSQKIFAEIDSSYSFFISEDSNVIHHWNCSCLKEILSGVKGFGTLKGALKTSTILCPKCFQGDINLDNNVTVSEMIHIIELHNLCFSLKLDSKNQGRMFYITTNVGKWFFEAGTPCAALYHKNNIYLTKQQKSLTEYHKQPVQLDSDQEIIRYICKHDKQVLSGHYKVKTVNSLYHKK